MKRKKERHLPYYRVLEAVQGSKGCPLCALEETALSRYFEGILYEKVNDPTIREDLRKSMGFCARCAYRLSEFGDGLGTAILYEDQIRLIIDAVDRQVTQASEKRRGTQGRAAGHQGPCPACRFVEQVRSRNIRTLLDSLEDPEMRSALEQSRGLCYPHLRRALEHADRAEGSWLLDIHRPKLSALLHLLEEYRRKQDYRFSGESDAEERDSWLRALEFAVGRRGLF